MPSKNSYHYYSRFLRCLEKYLEQKVQDRKKDKFVSDPNRLCWVRDKQGYGRKGLGVKDIFSAFEYIFDSLIEKAPSACMGADDWLDKFFNNVDTALCTGTWCANPHCEFNNDGYPYNCSGGNLPSKCKTWKEWRFQWRSFPEKTECKGCKYYKPEKPYKCPMNDRAVIKRIYEANKYKCYCRAKELPNGCPKKGKKDGEAKA